MSELNIADALLEIQEGEVDIEHDIRIAHLSAGDIHDHLNDAVDRLEESPLNVSRPELFDKLRCFVRDFSMLKPHVCNRVADVLLSGINAHIDLIAQQSKDPNCTSLAHHRDALERFAFLLQWLVSVAEARESAKNAEEVAATGRVKRGRGTRKKAATGDADDHWDWPGQRLRTLDTMR
ncbi:non-SMC mitotic condensation complex subunit 1, partial [Thamnocephalis sphaerospora]